MSATRMEFTIRKSDFLQVLNTCHGVIPTKGPKAILSYFHIKAAPGGIVVTATDLDNTISAEAQAQVVHGGAVALLAKTLLEIVRQLPDADIQVCMQENEAVKIRCDASDFQLSGQPGDEFPTAPGYEDGPFLTLDCQIFGDMIRKALIAIPAGEGETRYSMGGAQLSLSGDDITLLSTDGHRLSMVKRKVVLPGKTAEENIQILLSKKALSEIKKIIDDEEGTVLVSFQKRHAIIKINKRVLISRLLENSYPDYRQTIPSEREKENVVKISRVLFTQSLKRVAVLSDERSHGIRIQIAGNRMLLDSQDLELGDAHEETNVSYQGKDINIGLNVTYLIDALNVIDNEEVEVELSDAEGPCFIRPVGDLDYLCLIMPMRIDD